MLTLAVATPELGVRLRVMNRAGDVKLVEIKAYELGITPQIRDSLTLLDKIGFADVGDSYALFVDPLRVTGDPNVRFMYDTDTPLYSYSVIMDKNREADFSLEVNLLEEQLTFCLLLGKNRYKSTIAFNEVEQRIAARFEGYDAAPNRGWGFMYYLDAATAWKRSWSESDIRRIENLLDKGTSLNVIRHLLNNFIPVRQLEDFVELPGSWVDKIGEGFTDPLPPKPRFDADVSSRENVPF